VDNHGRTSAALEEESSGRSISGMMKDIGAGIRDIVRSEIKLAKVELADTAGRVRSASIMLGGGGILGIYAIGFILLAAFFALEIVLPAWLAALILGGLLFIGAAVGIASGRARLKTIRGPRQTMQTMKEDLQWIKEQARS
jgi:uncharacterized membrane protein YqjE